MALAMTSILPLMAAVDERMRMSDTTPDAPAVVDSREVQIKHAAMDYAKYSCTLLLGMRHKESGNGAKSTVPGPASTAVANPYKDFPLRAMVSIVESFCDMNTHIFPRAYLEQLYPYACVHSGLVDISLGRQRATDSIKGMHMSGSQFPGRNRNGADDAVTLEYNTLEQESLNIIKDV